MRSIKARRRLQAVQWEGGETSDWWVGRRSIQTLRKLAIIMPNRQKKTIIAASITLYFGGLRP
jgi:hypothetical protein